ncbi:hypothetical protein [Methylopila sp. M107]|uniref:hypothetical protein n=1 Tax=Methylopila sp. M107 TaxID=1101190 RepID=UPI00036DAE1A|nr:hypothetical protein [Methylopila sp. M107]
MANARLIRAGGRTVGLLVRVSSGRFRFFSSTPAVDALDNRVFRSLAATVRAVRDLSPTALRS